VTWIAEEPEPVDGPRGGPERALIESYLDYQRATLLNICAGLTADQLAAQPIPSTNLSLLGLVRHLAKVERIWFRIRAAGEPIDPLFDVALGKDYDFEGIDMAQAEEDFATYRRERDLARAAAATIDFEAWVPTREEPWSLRLVHLHVIGEYARHNGHADLLRQAVDGVVDR
jgi:uncharacterized damage-inducible protein DinB